VASWEIPELNGGLNGKINEVNGADPDYSSVTKWENPSAGTKKEVVPLYWIKLGDTFRSGPKPGGFSCWGRISWPPWRPWPGRFRSSSTRSTFSATATANVLRVYSAVGEALAVVNDYEAKLPRK